MTVGADRGAYRRPLIGLILLGQRKVTIDHLDDALGEQARTGRRLGEILCRMGVTNADDIADALQVQADASTENGAA